jgi:hypothetical protein
MTRAQQMSIDFTPGLLEQFPRFMDCVRASVYQCRRQFKGIAADLDLSVSELSRQLADNPNDPRVFPLDRLPELVLATGNTLPIQWLALSFMNDPEAEQRRALRELAQLAPLVNALAERAGLVELVKPGKAAA